MTKLWKVKENDWGRDYPLTIYAESREEALQKASKYPAHDNPEYAGRYSEENAKKLMEQ